MHPRPLECLLAFLLATPASVGAQIASGGAYTLSDTLGQPWAGSGASANYTLADGFWSMLETGPGAWGAPATTWGPGGQYLCQINQAASALGADPGWDYLDVHGALTITATAGAPFVLAISSLQLDDTPGPVHDFARLAYVWPIAQASGGISGFDPAKFQIDLSGFGQFTWGGSFGLTTNGQVLNLTFTPHACGSDETTFGYALDPPNAVYLSYTNACGLSSAEGLTTNNCTMTATAYGPAFPSGTNVGAIEWHVVKTLPTGTTNLTIHAVKIISGSSATVNARVVDSCGTYSKQFDPVFAQVLADQAGQARQVYSGVLAAEHFVRLDNGQPGLDRIKVVVNGRAFEVNPLAPGQGLVLDVRAAMNEGDQNTIVFLGWGQSGAGAGLQIADRATQAPLVLTPRVEPPLLTIARDGHLVVLTWLGPANFFILETSDGFGSPWQAVLAIQEESEGSTQVLWQIQPGPALFRLRQ